MRSHVESVAKAMFGVLLTLIGCSPTGVDQTTQAPITDIARDTPQVCRVTNDGSPPAGLASDTCSTCTTEWEFDDCAVDLGDGNDCSAGGEPNKARAPINNSVGVSTAAVEPGIIVTIRIESAIGGNLMVTVTDQRVGTQVTQFFSDRPAVSGGRLSASGEGVYQQALQRGRQAAADHVARHYPGRSCITRITTAGIQFAIVAIVMLAYNGYVDAAQAAAGRIIRDWEAFYGDCRQVNDWMQSSFNRLTQEDAASCRACYQRRFPSPGSGALTVCTSSFANPQAGFQQLVQEVGERVEQVATSCAAFPGGYYSRPFTQPLLFADRPNQTPIERVCPY